MRAAAALLLACAIGGAPGAQQTPPRDTRKPPPGTASVSGRVTDRETGQPLRRVKVELSGLAGSGSRMFEVETGADGRYTFTDLPAGEYHATASPGEYRADYRSQSF